MKKIKIILKKQNDKKEIYEEVLKYNENIENIDLSNQNLIEIPKGLEQFKNLRILDLYNNQISKIENLDKNIDLTYLNLNNNKISKIENLDNNINLTYLDLSNNKISKIENLDNNINLKNLYLENNKITKIEHIHHLEKLEYLSVFDEYQNENIKESLSISLDNYNLELKEIQIKEELLKQELLKQKEKEYFDNNFEKLKQQFIASNHQNNDLLI